MPQVTPVDDRTNAVLSAALSGLAARQRASARNIANADTPGFIAQRIDFETSLRAAIADGDPAAARPMELASDAPVAANGNNVQLDDETVSMEETGLRYQLLTEVMSTRIRMLRDAMGKGV